MVMIYLFKLNLELVVSPFASVLSFCCVCSLLFDVELNESWSQLSDSEFSITSSADGCKDSFMWELYSKWFKQNLVNW